ncbi:hypothetical protein BBOR36S_01061 [Brevibacillus borstelensis]
MAEQVCKIGAAQYDRSQWPYLAAYFFTIIQKMIP